MGSKFNKDSLTGKMVQRLLAGLGVGIFVIALLYIGGRGYLKSYLFSSSYLNRSESKWITALQSYVTQEHLAATDTDGLRAWAEETGIKNFVIYRDEMLLFDLSLDSDIYPGARERDLVTWEYYTPVTFSDGKADVFLYDESAEIFDSVLLAFSVILGFASCLGVFISGMNEDVRYIRKLEKEVGIISSGNLQETVTILGKDELAGLAAGLDRMRLSLAAKEQKEREMRDAQEKLVLGMSHDLRTPLTGLMTYLDILKMQEEKDGKIQREYLDKAYERVEHIRTLSDRMFEYFLIDSKEVLELEEPELISCVLEEYLSGLCFYLESAGFTVSPDISWRPLQIQVSTDYLGRIINNLTSNMEKYADKSEPVQLRISYDKDKEGLEWVVVTLLNRITLPNTYVEGSGIGVTNISLMMQQMGGSMRVEMKETEYKTILYFPAADPNAPSGKIKLSDRDSPSRILQGFNRERSSTIITAKSERNKK